MSKRAIQLMGVSLVLGMGLAAAPAIAQETGVANTAEDFKSPDAQDGFFGSGTSIWDLFHNSRSLSGGGVIDDSVRRSQARQINRQAESFRERQRASLQQQSAEAAAPIVEVDATTEVDAVE